MSINLFSPTLAALQSPIAEQPPGMEKVQTVLNWGLWGFSILCLLGFLSAAAKMLQDHRSGMGGEAAISRVGWVAAACLLGSAASAIVNVLIG